ncbi:PIG-L deacetylase family protein [Streptomyces sp. NPDC051098]|uniref:PIG-L deacetylase family protein n=1 Tax=Streptomyces sp. NPDC051098 TaxID=3155411 RepID=UPI00341F19B5
MSTVLAVVAHPDDEVIGPGGTLARHAKAGDEVHVLILAEGKTSRADDPDPEGSAVLSAGETAASCAVLGAAGVHRLDLADNQLDTYPLLSLAQRVGDVVERLAPHTVYTHHSGDLNIDHELTARACMIACRPHVSPVRWLLGFSTLSATDAGYAGRQPFVPALYSDISDTLALKLDAMRCYASELRDFPHPRSLKAIGLQAELFGAHADTAAAEAFSVLRGTWDTHISQSKEV